MEKINVAELLKDCPQGMELDCTMYDNITFWGINKESATPISIRRKDGIIYPLTKYGQINNYKDAKCVIFPKGKTTWEGFVPPYQFKDGDVVITTSNNIHLISCHDKNNGWESCCGIIYGKFDSTKTAHVIPVRFATEEEKAKLFQAIKDNGYRWNPETKTLENLPKFKMGDRIKNKHSGVCDKVIKIFKDCYLVENCFDERSTIGFDIQDNWELVSNKFDISTLKPFESRVLVRDDSCYEWEADIFGRYSDGYITLGGSKWKQCIPYGGNEHLLGTANDCDNYFKIWENEKNNNTIQCD